MTQISESPRSWYSGTFVMASYSHVDRDHPSTTRSMGSWYTSNSHVPLVDSVSCFGNTMSSGIKYETDDTRTRALFRLMSNIWRSSWVDSAMNTRWATVRCSYVMPGFLRSIPR